MTDKPDAYATAFLRTCYDAGKTAEEATMMLLKQGTQNMRNNLPVDNVTNTIWVETARRTLARHPSTN